MFTNSRTGSKSKELKAYQTESESEAKARLESAGWDLSSGSFDESKKIFTTEEVVEDGDEGKE